MTLGEVVERARSVSPHVARLRLLEEAAREGEQIAASGRMPQIEISAAYSRNSDVPEFATGIGPARTVIFPNIPDNYRARAAASLPLYTGGRLSSQIDVARYGTAAATDDAVAGERDLVLEASTAYWSLVTARENERVLTAALDAFEQHLVDARNRFDLGLAARNELLAVQAERDRAELQRVRAENNAAVAHANLLRILDLGPDLFIVTADGLAAAAVPIGDLEALVDEAEASRAELRSLSARVDAADAYARAARASRLPQASLSAAYDYASPNQKILPLTDSWEDTWSVGVGVSWTLFDGGRTAASEAKARAEAESLRRLADDARQRVRLEVTGRALELDAAIAAVAVSKRGLEAAAENERVSRDRYREGVASSSDLLDAETQTLRAGLDLVAAQSSLRTAEAQLARALGR
ncbi:MAG: TolC family protein [Acidobacteria bacterium]|nr:TolC family protein [Acidobacteriota bacterium]